jgi:hypothetical protein
MLLSVAVYLGLVVLLVGLLLTVKPMPRFGFHRWGEGARMSAVAAAVVVILLLRPAPHARVTVRASKLDSIMPAWQFGERHSRRVDAPPARVLQAIRDVRADEILLFNALTWIRRGGRDLPAGILNAGDSAALLDVATRNGFVWLGDDSTREIVAGTVIAAPEHGRLPLSPGLFRQSLPMGWTLATINFVVEPDGPGSSIVTTETRVRANGKSARRRFGAYWRLIYPGSSVLRYTWLRAIAKRATGPLPVAALAPNAAQPERAPITPTAPRVPMHLGPFTVDGRTYTFRIDPEADTSKPKEAAARIRVFDASGRTLYDEDLVASRNPAFDESWTEFYPSVLEDDAGRARAFEFGYAYYPSAPSSGVVSVIVAPRGDSLVMLTESISYFGNMESLPAGSQPRSQRLLPGNTMMLELWRYHFGAAIPLQFDLGCVPRSEDCVRVALPDSIAGLARFKVRPSRSERRASTVTIEAFVMPLRAAPLRLTITPDDEVEIIDGAARVFITTDDGIGADQDWLQIRVKGQTYWITGSESFDAIGLLAAG